MGRPNKGKTARKHYLLRVLAVYSVSVRIMFQVMAPPPSRLEYPVAKERWNAIYSVSLSDRDLSHVRLALSNSLFFYALASSFRAEFRPRKKLNSRVHNRNISLPKLRRHTFFAHSGEVREQLH